MERSNVIGADHELFKSSTTGLEEKQTWSIEYHSRKPAPMSDYFDNEQFSDCTLILPSGRTLKVHRLVLSSHSDFFRAAFSGRWDESNKREFELNFDDPARVQESVIQSLYTGEIEISSQNAIPVLVASEQLQIHVLKDRLQTHISRHVDHKVATRYFLEASRFPEGTVLAETFVGRVAPYMHQVLETHREELLELPPHIAALLTNHPGVVVRQEGDLYRFVVEYLSKREGLANELMTQIIQGIQFAHLSSAELAEASAHELMPEKLVMTGMLERLQRFETNSQEAKTPGGRHCVQQHTKFSYQSDLDTNGILYHLGTLEGTAPYSNPAEISAVVVESGKMCYGDICHVVGRVGADVWTDDDPNETWYLIDFGEGRSVHLEAYTMRRGGGASRARDWILEGSTSARDDWTEIYEHSDDRNLENTDDDYGTYTWRIQKDSPGASLAFQRFRLRMTKPAHDGDWYFAVSGVEFYGDLVTQC